MTVSVIREDAEVMIIKDYDSVLHVYLLPLKNGLVQMPDIEWFHHFASCADFGPEIEGGQIVKGSLLECRALPEGVSNQEWKWSIDGKNLGKYTENMMVPNYTIDGNYVVIGSGVNGNDSRH
jgi:hypothetical protein